MRRLTSQSNLSSPPARSLFVAIVVSLSSTTVVANNLTHSDHNLAHGELCARCSCCCRAWRRPVFVLSSCCVSHHLPAYLPPPQAKGFLASV